MPVEVIFIITLIILFLFLFLGMYIHSMLLITGIIGIILLEGPAYVFGFLESDPFIRVASYSLTTIPLYILMAQFTVRAGVVEEIYNFIYNISKGKKSLLGVLTVLAGGFLGAVSGSTNASAAAMGQVAVPQLKRRGYSEGLAGGTIAAAGSLSSVIPPSIILILWGVSTETPIGKLFIGSIIPGLIIMLVVIIAMMFFLKREDKETEIKFDNIPSGEEQPTSPGKIISSISLVVFIVFIVFFGIYAGIFTPTEAGAVGALAALVVAIILGKVNLKFLINAFSDTIKVTAMIMMIVIGAQLLGRFVSISLLPREIIQLLSSLIEYPTLILIILFIIYFLMFMIIEGVAVMVMTAPIVLPLISEIGVDKIWFGVLVGILATIGLLTPPVGLSVYSVSGATGIPSAKVFKYAFRYAIIIALVMIPLLLLFPSLVTWLPSNM